MSDEENNIDHKFNTEEIPLKACLYSQIITKEVNDRYHNKERG
jgi:hypothetical protein